MSEITFGEEADTDNEPPRRGGQPRQHTGSDIGEILNREDTKNEIKFGTTFFALVGLGLGLGVVLANVLTDVVGWGSLMTGITLAPLLAVYISQRQSSALSDAPNNIAYGTAAVTAIAGTLVLGLLLWLFGEIASLSAVPDLGDLLLAVIGIGIGAAVVGVGMIWVMRNVIEDWN